MDLCQRNRLWSVDYEQKGEGTMETLSVSRFKATCLSVLEEVKTKKKRVRITKRGKPILLCYWYRSGLRI
jgi:hypothetical protein